MANWEVNILNKPEEMWNRTHKQTFDENFSFHIIKQFQRFNALVVGRGVFS